MRDFLRLFCERGVLGSDSTVSLNNAMRALAHTFKFPENEMTDVLSVECIFPEFVDVVVRMAELIRAGGTAGCQLDMCVRDIAERVCR